MMCAIKKSFDQHKKNNSKILNEKSICNIKNEKIIIDHFWIRIDKQEKKFEIYVKNKKIKRRKITEIYNNAFE